MQGFLENPKGSSDSQCIVAVALRIPHGKDLYSPHVRNAEAEADRTEQSLLLSLQLEVVDQEQTPVS